MKSQYQTDLIEIINKLIVPLEGIKNLSLDNLNDEKLLKSFKSIQDNISKGISHIKKEVEILSKDAEWNTLNVSFFGETNAGKSTLIEALTNGDGKSIGEGRKDFTQTVESRAYKNIQLMDMPGIEGNEETVIENIRHAVNKSHVVFYVIGTNKEPEEGTITKVKSFLKDNAEVYSLINVRGKPTVYKYKPLIDKNILTIEARIQSRFEELLGGNYSGNIIVNGYLALLTSNNLENTRFEKDQIKALEIFGDKTQVENFSGINRINKIIGKLGSENDEVIKSLEENRANLLLLPNRRDLDSVIREIDNLINKYLESERSDKIKISNTYKFLKSLEEIRANVLNENEQLSKTINEIDNLTEKYLEEVNSIIKKYYSEINNYLSLNINKLKSELKKAISDSIDDEDGELDIKIKLYKIKKEQSKDLKKGMENLLSSMESEIEGKIKEFKNRISLLTISLNLEGEFNLENILEALEFNFKYILGEILDVGLSIWGVVLAFGINPILGIVTGVLTLARKIWDWFYSDPAQRKREAKQKANNEINSSIKNLEKKVKNKFDREFSKINRDINKPVKQLKNSIKGIKSINLSIDDKIAAIKTAKTDLSLLLTKEILGTEVTFSYIDLHLSMIVIIGMKVNDEVKKHIANKFRVKTVILYSSCSEWRNKDDFNYRTINALLLDNRCNADKEL